MPTLFDKETASNAAKTQDRAKLAEMTRHQLLKANENGSGQIATFDEVRAVGRWFLNQRFNTVIPSTKQLPAGLLARYEANGGGTFLGKVAFGSDEEKQFPATIEVVKTPRGKDLRIHIVPIHFEALKVAQFGSHTDSLLALAAAAAVAPHFVLGLEGGLTGDCSTGNVNKTEEPLIKVDHGTPLAAVFESFQSQNSGAVLSSALEVTGNDQLTIEQAAHLHHLRENDFSKISSAAANSKISAGVPVRSLLRNELPKHVLFVSTSANEDGKPKINTMEETLFSESGSDFGLVATALGMTATVVGDSDREKRMERVLSVKSGDTPLSEIIR